MTRQSLGALNYQISALYCTHCEMWRGQAMSIPIFLVGTGRCGSTTLSNMLREHPKVLSLSEFFLLLTDGLRTQAPFSQEIMDGRRFWSILAAVICRLIWWHQIGW